MFRKKAARFLAVASVALSLSACSGGGNSGGEKPAPPKAWASDAVKEARSISAELRRSDLGCRGYGVASAEDYAALGGGHFTLPEAVARCTSLKEDVEISVLADAPAAKSWVEERRKFLCAAAAEADVQVDGFPYVLLGRVVLQPDTDPVGREIADALGGKFGYARCERGSGGWDDAAVATVIRFSKAIDDAGFDCADFKLTDPDIAVYDFTTRGLPEPLAIGICTGSKLTEGVPVVLSITAFASSADRQSYITYQEQSDCALQSGVPIAKTVFVLVDTYLVETRVPAQAQGAATALGGEVVTNDACADG